MDQTFIKAIWQEGRSIRSFTHYAILYGMNNAWSRCEKSGIKPRERDFVFSLVLDSVPLMYDSFKYLFKRHNIPFSIISVYCRRTPKVTYAGISKKSCALGDILFVHIHRGRSGEEVRNALLCQAKAAARKPYHVSPSERDQLELYTNWPDFTYCSSGTINGKTRSINPKAPHSGAQYLLIDNKPPDDPDSGLSGKPGFYPVGSCMPDQYLFDHNDLTTELYDFFIFHSGRSFESRRDSEGKRDWSEIVWDLLDIGLKKAFNRRKSVQSPDLSVSDWKDQLTDGAFFAQSSKPFGSKIAEEILGPSGASILFQAPDIPQKTNIEEKSFENNKKGVSIVLFETGEGILESKI